jgi:membrane-bound serine protease (ClpP class)
MGVSLSAALGVAIPFAVIVVILMRAVLRSRSWRQGAGKEELLEEEGEVIEPIGAAPATGLVRVHGELWRAASQSGESIPKGARARVKRVDGLTVQVEPVAPSRSAAS